MSLSLAHQGLLRVRQRAVVGCACQGTSVGSQARFNRGKTPEIIGAKVSGALDAPADTLSMKLGVTADQAKIGMVGAGAALLGLAAYFLSNPKKAGAVPIAGAVLKPVAVAARDAARDFTKGKATWPILSGIVGFLGSGVINTAESIAVPDNTAPKMKAILSGVIHGGAAFGAYKWREHVEGNAHAMLTGALVRQCIAAVTGPASELYVDSARPLNVPPPPSTTPSGAPSAAASTAGWR